MSAEVPKINTVCHGMRIWLLRSDYKSKADPLVLDCHNFGKNLLQNNKQMKNLHENELSWMSTSVALFLV